MKFLNQKDPSKTKFYYILFFLLYGFVYGLHNFQHHLQNHSQSNDHAHSLICVALSVVGPTEPFSHPTSDHQKNDNSFLDCSVCLFLRQAAAAFAEGFFDHQFNLVVFVSALASVYFSKVFESRRFSALRPRAPPIAA